MQSVYGLYQNVLQEILHEKKNLEYINQVIAEATQYSSYLKMSLLIFHLYHIITSYLRQVFPQSNP